MIRRVNNTNKVISNSNKNKETLLVDGNSLFTTGYHGAKNMINTKGEVIGGLYQFLTTLRKIMNETIYDNIYVFWDGEFSGKLRYDFYPEYKANRNKNYEDGTKPDDENMLEQQIMVKMYMEEFFIKQLESSDVEGDDFIAYYCLNKKSDENITICTSDNDICQLIDDNIRVYRIDKKKYLTKYNYQTEIGYSHENICLIKTILGDSSDNIFGVEGLGLKTLLKQYPYLVDKKSTLEDVFKDTFKLLEERKNKKLKPLKFAVNLIDGVSKLGKKGVDLYILNDKLVNLKKPLITNEGLDDINHLMNNNLTIDDRNMSNVVELLKEHEIYNEVNKINDYLLTFKKYSERHKKQFIN